MTELKKQNEAQCENNFFDAFNIEKTIIILQKLGMKLKKVIFKLPDSPIRQYLLLETSKVIEFKAAKDFYYLRNKITRMIEMIIRWNLDGEILDILEEINFKVGEIVDYVEKVN